MGLLCNFVFSVLILTSAVTAANAESGLPKEFEGLTEEQQVRFMTTHPELIYVGG